MGFKNDLEFGLKYENKSIMYYQDNGYSLKIHCKGNFSLYDFIVEKDDKEYKIEVKSDRLYKTGNICIEYAGKNDRKSGITITEADYYNYYIVNDKDEYEFYIIPVEDIKKMIDDKLYHRKIHVYYGNSKCYLFKKEKFKKYLVLDKDDNKENENKKAKLS
jgi:hypothetical protein